jgi:hypothetical protein
MPVRGLGWHWLWGNWQPEPLNLGVPVLCRHARLINVKPITAQEKLNFPRANAILARAQALLWVRDWPILHACSLHKINVQKICYTIWCSLNFVFNDNMLEIYIQHPYRWLTFWYQKYIFGIAVYLWRNIYL